MRRSLPPFALALLLQASMPQAQGPATAWGEFQPDAGWTVRPAGARAARWKGSLWVDRPGTWTLTLRAEGRVRLWLDGELRIEGAKPFERDLTTALEVEGPGTHGLEIEQLDRAPDARLQLLWRPPGGPRRRVPASALVAPPGAPAGRLDAGPDRVLLPPDTEVVLQGHWRDAPEAEPLPANAAGTPRWLWRQTHGPPATLGSPRALSTSVRPSQPGVLEFELQARTPGGWVRDRVRVVAFTGHRQGLVEDGPRADFPTIVGNRRAWQELTFTFTHDQHLSETSTSPNPFLDLRLLVHLVNVDEPDGLVTVPGYFAADGRAADTGADTGTRWRAHFRPPRPGRWFWLASFVAGPEIAVDPDPTAGQPVSFDGTSGILEIGPPDPRSQGFERKGLLEYVGRNHLRFAETGEWFVKAGTNSPENFLAYYEFDATFDQGGLNNDLVSDGHFDGLHHYDAHLDDYVDRGIPLWRSGRGRRIFGAIDYLASRGVNSLYFITYNLDGGDGREVWPWRDPVGKRSFDVSKLDQWHRVFDHMTRAGVALHLLTQETENDHAIDGGALGTTRKLYYRELSARFGHALALIWNLGEENDNTTEERMAFAEYIRDIDPYDHPITVLARSGEQSGVYQPLLGTHLEAISLQGAPQDAPIDTATWVDRSNARGRAWSVFFDEVGPAQDGVVPDSADPQHDTIRKEALWGGLMSRGGGPEWYFGYAWPHSDLDCEDFSSRERMWELTDIAAEFFRRFVPFPEPQPAPHLSTHPTHRILALPGEAYALYLPNGGPADLNLEGHTGPFRVRWYDPLAGGDLQVGTVDTVQGPGLVSLGLPPDPTRDWAAIVRTATNRPPALRRLQVWPDPWPGVPTDFSLRVWLDDPDGAEDIASVRANVVSPAGLFLGSLDLVHVGGDQWALWGEGVPTPPVGTWTLWVVARDRSGGTAFAPVTFTVP